MTRTKIVMTVAGVAAAEMFFLLPLRAKESSLLYSQFELWNN